MNKKVTKKYRASVYQAAIIVEFLNKTFMPLNYFIKPSELMKIIGKKDILRKTQYIREDEYETATMTMGDLYQIYRVFRQHMTFTAPIESFYKFSRVISSLGYYKNGWQFTKVRKTRGQLVYLYPVLLRVRVPEDVRKNFPPGAPNLTKAEVELMGPCVASPELLDLPQKNFKEAKWFIEAKWFTEAKYFIEVKAEWHEAEYEEPDE